jgi:hypothetical protein
MNNAILRAKIEYIAKTKQPNGCIGDYIDELRIYKNDFTELKKYVKYLGFRLIREYEIDGDRWIEMNKNIRISEEGFVTFYKAR